MLSFEEARVRTELVPITRWIEDFLCAPNSSVGRSGDVCPYTRAAIRKNAFRFAISRARSVAEFEAEIKEHLVDIERTGEAADIYRCRLIVPVALDRAANVIEDVQRALKPLFVARRLMLGQFYPECDERGLWNPGFRPLQCPVPLIAIRGMVPTDVAFLYDNAELMAAYNACFKEQAARAIRQYEQHRGITQ
ncbi:MULTISPECIES: DUF6875 domain-containing protein [Burkholderia]|uniref:DUF6875 domain-containing protein n=1 Tax=Burkholderia TaxID=32008 RepID=UPI000F7AD6B4|nr:MULTISPECIES: hypothetical protein [Burkholderia]